MGWTAEDIWKEFNRDRRRLLNSQGEIIDKRISLLQAATRMEIAEAIRDQTEEYVKIADIIEQLRMEHRVAKEWLHSISIQLHAGNEQQGEFNQAILDTLGTIFCFIDAMKGARDMANGKEGNGVVPESQKASAKFVTNEIAEIRKATAEQDERFGRMINALEADIKQLKLRLGLAADKPVEPPAPGEAPTS